MRRKSTIHLTLARYALVVAVCVYHLPTGIWLAFVAIYWAVEVQEDGDDE